MSKLLEDSGPCDIRGYAGKHYITSATIWLQDGTKMSGDWVLRQILDSNLDCEILRPPYAAVKSTRVIVDQEVVSAVEVWLTNLDRSGETLTGLAGLSLTEYLNKMLGTS